MRSKRVGVVLGVVGCALALLAGCSLFQNPPVASFAVLYGVDETDPLVVDLDASASSDPDGDVITTYQWAFGDDVTIITPLDVSKTVTVPVLRVRYPLEGTYAVQLVVWDKTSLSSQPVSGTVTVPAE